MHRRVELASRRRRPCSPLPSALRLCGCASRCSRSATATCVCRCPSSSACPMTRTRTTTAPETGTLRPLFPSHSSHSSSVALPPPPPLVTRVHRGVPRLTGVLCGVVLCRFKSIMRRDAGDDWDQDAEPEFVNTAVSLSTYVRPSMCICIDIHPDKKPSRPCSHPARHPGPIPSPRPS